MHNLSKLHTERNNVLHLALKLSASPCFQIGWWMQDRVVGVHPCINVSREVIDGSLFFSPYCFLKVKTAQRWSWWVKETDGMGTGTYQHGSLPLDKRDGPSAPWQKEASREQNSSARSPIFIFYKTRFDVSSSLVCLSCLSPKLHSCTQTRCLLAIQESRPTSMHTHEGHRPSHTCTGHRLPLEDITWRSALFYGLFLWLVCLKHACSIHQTQLPLGRPKKKDRKRILDTKSQMLMAAMTPSEGRRWLLVLRPA